MQPVCILYWRVCRVGERVNGWEVGAGFWPRNMIGGL